MCHGHQAAQRLSLGVLGTEGEVDVVGPERAQVPGVTATSALMRCLQCERISLASMMIVRAKDGELRKTECRTALGRFEGVAWIPAAPHLVPLVISPKSLRQQRLERANR